MLTSCVSQLKTNSFARWLGVICLVAITLRLIWLGMVAHIPIQLSDGSDQASYLQQAESFSRGNGYSNFYAPPLYPLFMGVIITLQRWLGLRAIPIRLMMGLVHIAIVVGTVALTACLGRRRLSAKVGLLAAAILAIWPNQVMNVGNLMTEQLSTPLFLGGVTALLWDRKINRQHAIISGSLFGLSILARPALFPIIMAAIIVIGLSKMGRQLWWNRSLWLIGATCLVISPWVTYVYAQTGTPTIGTAGGFNLCLGNNDSGLTTWSQASIDAYCPFPGSPADDQELTRKAVDWMLHHPQKQPGLIARRAFETFNADFSSTGLYPTGTRWQVSLISKSTVQTFGPIWWFCILASSIAGLIRLQDRWLRLSFVIIGVASILMPLLSVSSDRYHDALVPIMALTAAYGSLRAGTLRARLIERFSRSKLAAHITR